MIPLPSLANAVATALPGALLLWLAASLAVRARAEPVVTRSWVAVLAVSLAGVGLWWPIQSVLAGAVISAPTLASQLGLVALCMALPLSAAIAAHSGARWFNPRRLTATAATWLLATACLAAVGVAPLGLAAVQGNAPIAAGLAASLIAMAWPWSSARRATALHAIGAAGVAIFLTFGLVPRGASPSGAAVPALWPTLVMILLGGGLLGLLRHGPIGRAGTRISTAPEPSEDALTRLPTRTHFETQLAAAVVHCDSNSTNLALLFIDLDGFKPVNDTFGHSSGDRVLQNVGKRLKGCAQGADVVARVGGDEFLMLIADAPSQEALAQRAAKIVEALSQSFDIEGRQVGISCSIGIAQYPENGQHAKLIARADAAMYAAKRAGGAGFCFFAPAMEEDARERFDLLRDLRMALENNQLELYYQPKMDAASGKVTAAEALLRWRHPTRGMVAPSVFIPIAERFGLIRSIGQWVIEDACRQARVWLDKGLRMRVAINLSAVQMRQEDIVARIEGALARHRVDPSLLTCEITESVAMEDTKATQATFRELGAAGIHLSIDDFGTGYSSLAYLRKLPAEELKIDRSFVMDVEFSADARAVIDAVVKLAHALGLKVVAEGIENERQQQILVGLGCDELQGFLFAKPMTARALLLWAIDDRKEQVQSFATSLFADTADFQATGRGQAGFADTAKLPLLAPAEHKPPVVH